VLGTETTTDNGTELGIFDKATTAIDGFEAIYWTWDDGNYETNEAGS
jgi:hypothetical protein